MEWRLEWERFVVRLFAARELRTSVLVTFLKVEPFRKNRLRMPNDVICEITSLRDRPCEAGTHDGLLRNCRPWEMGANLSAPA